MFTSGAQLALRAGDRLADAWRGWREGTGDGDARQTPGAAGAARRDRPVGVLERERDRLELLYSVAAAGEHLSIDAAAGALADALVPELGDWALVALVDGGSEIETLAVSRSGDEDGDRRVHDLLERFPVELDPQVGIGLAIRTGTRIVYEDITDDLLSRSATSDEHLAMLRDLGMGAAVIEPLTVRGRTVGAIGCVNRTGRPLTAPALATLTEVSAHAAAVLDNARLHEALVERDRALRFSEAVLRAQGESGVEGLLVVAPDGQMLTYNSRFAELWEFSEEDLQGTDAVALEAAMQKVVDPAAFRASVEAAYADPVAPTRDEVHFVDGRVLDRYGAPLRFDDGTYVGWAWYFRDISEERRTQQSLAESGERFASLARTLQESLLPPDLPSIIGAEVAARYHPAGDGSEIGGDFYDVFQINEKEWAAIVGDVCGKGAPAARLTALARYTFRAAATRTESLGTNFDVLNDALLRQAERDRERNEHRFATVVAVRFHADGDGLAVQAGSAGHPPPLVVTSAGDVRELTCRGSLLGMFDRVSFSPTTVRLEAGETLVLYTDGVIEAHDGTAFFGEERLWQLLGEHGGRSAAEITAAVEDAVLSFQRGVARDDIAVVAVRAVEVGSVRSPDEETAPPSSMPS